MQLQQLTKDMQARRKKGEIYIENMKMVFADSKVPDFKRKDIVGDYIKYGDKNDYPEYLTYLFNKSAKHNAIVNGKCVYIFGNGLVPEDAENVQAQQFLKSANSEQDWNELMKECILDIENFGGFALECIPTSVGFKYYRISIANIRTDQTHSKYYYKSNWKDYREDAKIYEPFNRNIKDKPTIYYYKEYRCGGGVYPLPSWIAACNYIETDIEVSKATLTNAMTGFSASKFINFYNGTPDEAGKRDITTRLENAATGSEGKKILIGFNDDANKKPTVDDLGSSDLTKEDFTAVDNLITSNIFAGHSVTHPLLFGIQQEGKLGNSSELKIAYDIFKNTYANGKQKEIESIVNYFASIEGVNTKFILKDVEPVGLELNVADFKELFPKEWVLEKFGIDITKYEIAPTEAAQTEQVMVNDVLTNLTGRQRQNIMAIVRQFGQGKLTKQQASIMLKNGFGFTDSDVNDYLGIDDDPSTEDAKMKFSDDEITMLNFLNECGYNRDEYEVLQSMSLHSFLKLDEFDLTQKIKNVIKGGGLLSRIGDRIKKWWKKKQDDDVEFMTLYSYEKRAEAAGPSVLPTTRPFCKRLVELSRTKFWSTENIQALSTRLGYDVFDRAGGFWNNNGTIEFHCRHEWVANQVPVKKSKA